MHFHMSKSKRDPLRAKVKAAIDRDGLLKTAARIGVQPPTLQRYLSKSGESHKGTVALVERAFA
jgi:hypothetical protein